MLRKKFLLVIMIFVALLSACEDSVVHIGPKREVFEFIEKTYTFDEAAEIMVEGDSSNIEVYSWDKDQIKFEIKKRIRGLGEKIELEERLKYFEIDMNQEGNKISYKSKYKKGIKNAADTSCDLRLFLPRKIKHMYCNLDIGTIKFLDDIETALTMDTNMVNIDVKRLKGKLCLNGDMGSISLDNGSLKNGSKVTLNIGNIDIKAQYEENGVYTFETHTGNIDLQLPKEARINFENMGTVETNEFEHGNYSTVIKNSTDMGRITLKKY